MGTLTRRTFLAAATALPFFDWLEISVAAQTPLVRYDATSVEGVAMLKLYANAVANMTDPTKTPESSALSWLFQWYTHAVKLNSSGVSQKDAELKRVYGSATAPAAALAAGMWDTCQSHHPSGNEEYFLPWHRLYLYFFERIARKACGDSAFTLPYWDYSTADPVRHGVIPPEFRKPTDAVFKSLFRGNRNSGPASSRVPSVNAGDPIDKFNPGTLDLAPLKQGSYLPHGVLPGFNQSVDSTIHGFVHGLVGDRTNMGRVPTAASDPIFWLHHCNIDRLWASWNKNGGLNPKDAAFLAKTFTFADDAGAKPSTTPKVGDAMDTVPLGYTYQTLEPAPAGFTPLTNLTFTPTNLALMTAKSVGSQNREALFEMSAATPTPPALSDRVSRLPPGRRFYLVIRHVQASAPSGTLYNVYLNLPPGLSPAGRERFKAGTISFFGADHGGSSTEPVAGRFLSFDVTEILRSLQASQRMQETPRVTLLPAAPVDAGVETRVEGVSLVEQ